MSPDDDPLASPNLHKMELSSSTNNTMSMNGSSRNNNNNWNQKNNFDTNINHKNHENGKINLEMNGGHKNNLNDKISETISIPDITIDKTGTTTYKSTMNNGYNQNGNSENIINGMNSNGNANGGSGGGNNRRDSITHAWSPLLQKTSSDISTSILSDDNSLYNSSSNNNDWKESEEINNLKNFNLYNGNGIDSNKNNHHHNSNNNGSLLNGKNSIGIIIKGKLDENDPLTGSIYKKSKNNSLCSGGGDSSDTDDIDSSCGILNCRPKWAKNFASTHMFMAIFLLAWILQGMYLTYFVSCITTIEKLFQIKSKTTGMLMSASEIGQISTAMLLTYYAGRGHRPRWIAVGMVIFAIASFGCSLPHFIFGKQLLQSNAFSLANNNNFKLPSSSSSSLSSSLLLPQNNNTTTINETTSSSIMSLMMKENFNLCVISNDSMKLNDDQECEEDVKQEQASHSEITNIVLYIFFASLLSSGVGQTAVSTLGIPYIDDNVASRESPIYLAITIGVRILGPAAGFIFGSFCARIYVDLSDPGIEPTDPKWISAWWLGPVLIGTLMLLASIAMFSFPKQLRGNRIMSPNKNERTELKSDSEHEEENSRPKLKDFPKTVRRQLSNDILMFRTASSVFHILPIAGLYTFLPKYLETQFRLPAADAALISAFGGILVMGIGIVISGIIILKFNPSAKSVAAWIAFTAFLYSCGMAILMLVGCNMNDFAGLTKYDSSQNSNTISKFVPTCNTTCSCDFNKFEPICGADGQTYFSSCHAGCSNVERGEDGKDVYSNCECIPEFMNEEESYQAISGYCDNNCKSFILFLCLFTFFVFIHSTSDVGSMLLIMRCTDPKDKAMAMGVFQSAIGLFGNVPCPIIYGAVVDSACLVWKTVCGKPGACSLYDIDAFRHYFLGITAGIMMLAFVMDLIVWKKAHRIDIAPAESNNESETEYEKTYNTSMKNSSTETSA